MGFLQQLAWLPPALSPVHLSVSRGLLHPVREHMKDTVSFTTIILHTPKPRLSCTDTHHHTARPLQVCRCSGPSAAISPVGPLSPLCAPSPSPLHFLGFLATFTPPFLPLTNRSPAS